MKKIIVLGALFVASLSMAQQNAAMVDQQVSFSEVDNAPTFPGCENHDKQCFTTSISQTVSNNINRKALNNVSGKQRVVVSFTITANGKVTDVTANSSNPILEAEALKVINNLPEIEPATLADGKKVAVTYSLPIVFMPNETKKSNTLLAQPNRVQNN